MPEKDASMGSRQPTESAGVSAVEIVRRAGDLTRAGSSLLPALVGRDFAFAALWVVDRRCGVLRCAIVWPDSPRLDPFRRLTLESVFAPVVELPGRAWVQRKPAGVRELADDPNLPRGPCAAESGLVSGVAVPILVRGRVVAVVEGFRHEAAVAAPALAGRLVAAADELGSLIESGAVRVSVPGRASIVDERVRAARLAAVVELGRRALTGASPQLLAEEAVELAAITLNADQTAFLELDKGGGHFVVRAGVGWRPGVIGSAVASGDNSLAGYTVRADALVMVDVLATETRFVPHPVLLEHGVVSGVGAVIRGPEGPVGVMSALSGRRRRFGADELAFLRLLANTLAAAIVRARADDATKRSDSLLRAVVEGTTDTVFVKDIDGRYLMINAAGAKVLGRPPAEIVGLRAADVFPAEVAEEIGASDASVVARREWRTFEESIVTGADEARVYLSNKGPYVAPDGSIVGLIGIARDITERTRAEDRQRLVAAAAHALAKGGDERAAVREVAGVAVPAMADWCVIELIDSSGRVVPAAASHAQDKARLLDALQLRYPPRPDPSVHLAHVVHTARPELYQHTDAPRGPAAREDAHLELLRNVGFESAAVVPLVSRGQWVGAITLAVTAPRRYSPADLAVFEQLADRLALALDTARLHRDREQLVHVLQRCLLPYELPSVRGLELAARFHAAGDGSEPAGAFYDAFAVESGCVLVAGDVYGRGPGAAADILRIRHVLRAARLAGAPPDELLRGLNTELVRRPGSTPFCTAALARMRIDDSGADASVASAGHPAPLLVAATGEVTAIPVRGGPVGIVPEPQLHVEELRLEPADALVLGNDAIADTWRAGRQRSRAAGEGARAGADALAAEIEAAALRARLDGVQDEVAILVAALVPKSQ
jgi:PAS domain S-box-containing protein